MTSPLSRNSSWILINIFLAYYPILQSACKPNFTQVILLCICFLSQAMSHMASCFLSTFYHYWNLGFLIYCVQILNMVSVGWPEIAFFIIVSRYPELGFLICDTVIRRKLGFSNMSKDLRTVRGFWNILRLIMIYDNKLYQWQVKAFIIQFNDIHLDCPMVFHFGHIQVWTNQAILEWGYYVYAYAMSLEP